MAIVSVSGLSRSFGSVKALDNLSLTFDDGVFYALLGPSGSGKTTLLRMIAGFERPQSGKITMDGESVENVAVEHRRIGMVFQNYALFPNMSVEDNVAFGLAVRGDPKATIKKEVQSALDLVQLGALGKRRPHELSGGQRQRVALARAIVTKPRVLLLDEPLSALDKALRVDMQVELKRIQREVGITTIFVTHDQDEALTMSDRIGILRDGRLVQQGSPEDLYNNPETEFAARFLGDANIFDLKNKGTGHQLKDGTQVLVAADQNLGFTPHKIAVRPERMTLSDPLTDTGPRENRLSGIVENTFFAGNTRMCHINWAGDTVRVLVPNDGRAVPKSGTEVHLSWAPESSIALKAE